MADWLVELEPRLVHDRKDELKPQADALFAQILAGLQVGAFQGSAAVRTRQAQQPTSSLAAVLVGGGGLRLVPFALV